MGLYEERNQAPPQCIDAPEINIEVAARFLAAMHYIWRLRRGKRNWSGPELR
jgi:hypothetical protein